MLTVIFGAGASHDSATAHTSLTQEALPWRPPLTKDLFGADRIWFRDKFSPPPQLVSVLERIRRDTKQDGGLEGCLQAMKQELAFNPARWPQLVGVQEWISQVLKTCGEKWLPPLTRSTTYVDLISRLLDWDRKAAVGINLISFNYDILLEDAASICFGANFGRQDFDAYLKGPLKIFKPHGSVNWWWDIACDANRESISERPLSKNERSSMRLILGPRRIEKHTSQNNITFRSLPAIAIPVVEKEHNDFIFPPGHEKLMLDALANTTMVLIIGWAAAEKHFLAKFQERVKRQVPIRAPALQGIWTRPANSKPGSIRATHSSS